ncbi:MAG: hypothetical protein ABIA93_02640 [Candidatus Woesearchaeota archaeon]
MPCNVCEEVITTPLCTVCLQEAVHEWLQWEAPGLLPTFLDVSSEMQSTNGNTKCIKCHDPMGVCPYCYTQRLHDWLGTRPELQAQFLTFFNFDLWRTGYSQGA